ncbi:unnamed protein product, partial [Owenia fusiformis]
MDTSDHSSYHQKALEKICRLCGEKTTVYRKKYKPLSITKVQESIQKAIPGLKFDNDNPLYHPANICQKCYNCAKHYQYKDVFNSNLKDKITNINEKWIYPKEATREKCAICINYSDNKCLKPNKRKYSEIALDTSEISFNENDISDQHRSTPKKQKTPNKPTNRSIDLGMTPGRGRDQSIRELFKKPINERLSVLEEQLLTFLVKRKLKAHNDPEELIVNNKR